MTHDSLSEEDIRVYVDVVTIGFTKLLIQQIKVDPLKRARLISSNSRFTDGFSAVLNTLHTPKLNKSLRQSDIRNKLPDFYRHGKNQLRSAELSKIMKTIVRLGIREPAKSERKLKRRGPKTAETEAISGPNMVYHSTISDRDLRQVLSNRDALALIHSLLIDSNLLKQLMIYVKKVSLYIMIINRYNKKRALNVCRSIFPLTEKNSSFEADFEKILARPNKKCLDDIANKWAASYIENHGPRDYLYLLYVSGYYFFLDT